MTDVLRIEPVTPARWQDVAASFGTHGIPPALLEQVAGAELYHGVASTSVAAGFAELGRTGPTRPVLRLAL
jgi:hypothetical protein